MANDVQRLRCPGCGQSETFRVGACVWITVSGADSSEELKRDQEADYGSEEPCRCTGCGHQAPMGDFYDDRT